MVRPASGFSTGAVMPQCVFSFECRRRGAHQDTCKSKTLLNGCIPGAGWINGAECQDGASEGAKVGSPERPYQPCRINGYFNYGHNARSPQAVSPKNFSTLKGTFSPLSGGAAAGRFRGSDVSGCAAASCVSKFGPVAPCLNSREVVPDRSFSVPKKKQRGKKQFRSKKKRDQDAPGSYTPLQEKEDWEEEIQEVALKKTEKNDLVTLPYDPEDVLQFSLQDLTLQQSDPGTTANYIPAVHHADPFRWCCRRIPTESEQFEDAED